MSQLPTGWTSARTTTPQSVLDTLRFHQQGLEATMPLTDPSARQGYFDHWNKLASMFQKAMGDLSLDQQEKSGLYDQAVKLDQAGFKALSQALGLAPQDGMTAPEKTEKAEQQPQEKEPAKAPAWPSGIEGRYQEAGALGKTALGLGSKGEGVKEGQQLLEAQGFKLEKHGADGFLGPETRSQIMAYQKAKGLQESGAFDEKTIAALRQKPEAPKTPRLPEVISV